MLLASHCYVYHYLKVADKEPFKTKCARTAGCGCAPGLLNLFPEKSCLYLSSSARTDPLTELLIDFKINLKSVGNAVLP